MKKIIKHKLKFCNTCAWPKGKILENTSEGYIDISCMCDSVLCHKGRHKLRRPGTNYLESGQIYHVPLIKGNFCTLC